jgi:hypothetical protein
MNPNITNSTARGINKKLIEAGKARKTSRADCIAVNTGLSIYLNPPIRRPKSLSNTQLAAKTIIVAAKAAILGCKTVLVVVIVSSKGSSTS